MEVFYEEAFLKIFTKFTDSAHVFSYEFCEIFKNTFFHRTRLLPVSVITLVPFPIYQFIFLLPLFFFYQVTELQNYRSPYETIAIILPLRNHCNNPSWKDYEHNNFCKKNYCWILKCFWEQFSWVTLNSWYYSRTDIFIRSSSRFSLSFSKKGFFPSFLGFPDLV